jgi:hypothetical protein
MTAWKLSVLIVLATLLGGADAGAGAPLARKNEIKLFVTAANTQQALEALGLDESKSKQRTVCFFDTGERLLAANHLILRARQGKKGRGDSTVKLRAHENDTALSEAERNIQPEQDWTNENEPTHSRSLDNKSLAKGLVSEVISGRLPASALFSQQQHDLVTGRIMDFDWSGLRLYGPVDVMVWRQQWKLDGFPEDVTVELWQMQKEGKLLDILEVSTKVRADTDEQARELARRFFAAARAAGLGEPTGQTKTQMTLDFFQPGRVNR